MIKKLLLFLVLMMFVFCKNDNQDFGFEVLGTISGIPDSTLIYIRSNSLIDSTMAIGEKFRFDGKLEEPIWAILSIGNSSEQKPIWLENVQIEFLAEKNSLSNGIVTGGKVQAMANLLTEKKKPIRKAMDSLGTILAQETLRGPSKDSVYALYKRLIQEEIILEKDFIKENPNSLVSVFNLNRNRSRWEIESVRELFALMNNKTKETVYGKLLDRYLGLYKNPQIGDKYVDFVQNNVKGQRTKLSEIIGKYTLVEFWASWCVPCRKSNPRLVEYYKNYKNKGFKIVGVSLDENRESWLKAIKEDGLPWENLTDLKFNENEAALIYGVIGIPDNILIDEKGIIVGRNLREEILERKLEEVFSEQSSL